MVTGKSENNGLRIRSDPSAHRQTDRQRQPKKRKKRKGKRQAESDIVEPVILSYAQFEEKEKDVRANDKDVGRDKIFYVAPKHKPSIQTEFVVAWPHSPTVLFPNNHSRGTASTAIMICFGIRGLRIVRRLFISTIPAACTNAAAAAATTIAAVALALYDTPRRGKIGRFYRAISWLALFGLILREQCPL